MGWRLAWRDDDRKNNSLEWAPPLRVISFVTLIVATLDLMSDFLICNRIYTCLPNFQYEISVWAAYGYFFFAGVSFIVYCFEFKDVCLTLKNDEEDVFYARLAKSLVIAVEEVPLPALLHILFTYEPRLSLAQPVYFSSWIKLVALIWGIVKFAKLRFFWCCLPLNPKHEFRENIRRCFQLNLYRITMILVNVCHFIAIFIVICNIIAAGKGGQPIIVKEN